MPQIKNLTKRREAITAIEFRRKLHQKTDNKGYELVINLIYN